MHSSMTPASGLEAMALDHFIREEATITDKDARDTARANMSKNNTRQHRRAER